MGLIFYSCGKNDVLDATFEVTPYIQIEQGGEEYITTEVQGYYFYADSIYFNEVTYEDALAGTLRYKTGGTLAYTGLADRDENGTMYFRNLIQSEIILVLVNEDNEVYCWRQLYLEPEQNYIITRIRFRLWRSGLTYKESGWTVTIPPSDEEDEEDDNGNEEEADDGNDDNDLEEDRKDDEDDEHENGEDDEGDEDSVG